MSTRERDSSRDGTYPRHCPRTTNKSLLLSLVSLVLTAPLLIENPRDGGVSAVPESWGRAEVRPPHENDGRLAEEEGREDLLAVLNKPATVPLKPIAD